jgi:hypothetical protein
MINIKDSLKDYFSFTQKESEEKDREQAGTLRGGNAGVVLDGQPYAKYNCPRKTYLRYKGISLKDKEDSTLLMFEGGKVAEEIWKIVLSGHESDNLVIKREEEAAVSFRIQDKEVTGRPDFAIYNKEGRPLLGVEHKNLSSVYSSLDVRVGGEPGFDHLAQAGFYMAALGCQYKLIYTQTVMFPLIGWLAKKVSRDSPLVELNDKGEPKTLKPGIEVFDLRFGPNGVLQFKREEELIYKDSIITRQSIMNNYEYILNMDKTNSLGKRPKNIKWDGKEKDWTACTYCSLKDTCDRLESNPKAWLKEIQEKNK